MKCPDQINEYLSCMAKLGASKKNYRNVEFVHRARVSSRRLRALINIVQLITLDDKQIENSALFLRKITRKLGSIRQFDLLEKLINKNYQNEFPEAAETILKKARNKRKKLSIKAASSLHKSSQKIKKLKNQLVSIQDELMHTAIANSITILQNKAQDIYQSYSDKPDIGLLHEYRLAIKKWRYATEIAAMFQINTAIPVTTLKKLQSDLGKLTDFEGLLETVRFLKIKKSKKKPILKKLKRDIKELEDIALKHVSKPVTKVVKHYPLRMKPKLAIPHESNIQTLKNDSKIQPVQAA